MQSSARMHDSALVLLCAVAGLSTTGAHAAITISSQPTQGMACVNGICAPTAKNAVLNAGDLETLLASGNATVTTTGTGVQASDIDVKSALAWSSTGALSLLAKKSVAIDAPVSISGLSGLMIGTGSKNGSLSFGKKGNVSFANLSSQLSINSNSYTLVGDIKDLAQDIASNPSGYFALAASDDASGDGTYEAPPIGVFTGTFEGLGNTVANFSIDGGTEANGFQVEGFFAEIGANGTLKDFGLVNANILVAELIGKGYDGSGAMVGANAGAIRFCYATGTVKVVGAGKHTYPLAGGLVGDNSGLIANSYAATSVTGDRTIIGGLAGFNEGTIDESYATGSGTGGGLVGLNDQGGVISNSFATGNVIGYGIGGLVSINDASITNSYATGMVRVKGSTKFDTWGGGLVGSNGGAISFSYSTGAVTGGTGSVIGGLIGEDGGANNNDNYWDTETSGQNQGAGNVANDPGITGLTTAQFQSGLPAGFDPKIWAEKAKINDGFPYLLANKPAK
jgi:hypothetical protein